MAKTTHVKMQRLLSELSRFNAAAVALSGGVDSTLLLAAARSVLKDRVVAMTARSATHPCEESEHARKMAQALKVEHLFFDSDEMADPAFTRNAPDRCYHCKKRMFQAMRDLAAERGIEVLLHGANADDRSDFRPGFKAAQELGIQAPLITAGLTKAEIRDAARRMGLSNADRPAMACLATRIPYGVEITQQLLDRIRRAETLIRSLGIGQCRVRDHGGQARVEVMPADIETLCRSQRRKQLVDGLRALGYEHISLDLEGYVGGKMNRGVGGID